MARSLRRSVDSIKASAMRGVNLAGLEFAAGTLPGAESTNYTQNAEADYTYIAGKGFNVIRLPFLWERLQPTKSGALDDTYKGYIDNNIAWAGNNGLKIILEVHNYGGRDVSGSAQKINDGTLTYADFNDLWSRIATAYVANTTVWGYDLMNEPHDMPIPTTSSNYNTTATWTVAAQGAIDAIRAVDTSHYIIAQGDNWGGVAVFVDNYGSNPTPWWTDSANKLYYTWHYYFDSDHSGSYSGANKCFSGTGFGIRAAGDYLETLLAWADTQGVKVVIGEYGVPNPAETYGGNSFSGDYAWLTTLNDFLNVGDMHPNTIMIHWAMGSWYTSPTTLSPTSSYTVDREQMKIVGKHLGTL